MLCLVTYPQIFPNSEIKWRHCHRYWIFEHWKTIHNMRKTWYDCILIVPKQHFMFFIDNLQNSNSKLQTLTILQLSLEYLFFTINFFGKIQIFKINWITTLSLHRNECSIDLISYLDFFSFSFFTLYNSRI